MRMESVGQVAWIEIRGGPEARPGRSWHRPFGSATLERCRVWTPAARGTRPNPAGPGRQSRGRRLTFSVEMGAVTDFSFENKATRSFGINKSFEKPCKRTHLNPRCRSILLIISMISDQPIRAFVSRVHLIESKGSIRSGTTISRIKMLRKVSQAAGFGSKRRTDARFRVLISRLAGRAPACSGGSRRARGCARTGWWCG